MVNEFLVGRELGSGEAERRHQETVTENLENECLHQRRVRGRILRLVRLHGLEVTRIADDDGAGPVNLERDGGAGHERRMSWSGANERVYAISVTDDSIRGRFTP